MIKGLTPGEEFRLRDRCCRAVRDAERNGHRLGPFEPSDGHQDDDHRLWTATCLGCDTRLWLDLDEEDENEVFRDSPILFMDCEELRA